MRERSISICLVNYLKFYINYNMKPFIYQQARTSVLSIGFSLSFGAMFSKTWRVHKIFTAAKTLKKMVRSNKISTH